MYNDGVITTEFTGYYDNVGQEYVYPTVSQRAALVFDRCALFSWNNAFEASGITVTTAACPEEDISVGSTISASITASLLNTADYIDESLLQDREGTLYIGYSTGEDTITVSSGTVLYGSVSGVAAKVYHVYTDPPNKFWLSVGSAPSIVVNGIPYYMVLIDRTYPAFDDVYVYTDEEVLHVFYNENAGTIIIESRKSQTVTLPSGYTTYTIRKIYSANRIPTDYWTVDDTTVTHEEVQMVPMGIFRVSDIRKNGPVWTIEAFDRMQYMTGGDASGWISGLDFSTPLDISYLVSSIMAQLSLSYTISASAVNKNVLFSSNPFQGKVVTYREVIHWLAEAMGCNARMDRFGNVEFYTYNSTPVATITPYTIVNQSRNVGQYAIPQITELTVYGEDGTSYSSGTSGQTYTIMGNPLLPTSNTTAIDNLQALLATIPQFYVTTFVDACADPRIDAGDFLTVEKADGSTYLAPVMSQTIVWRGNCVTEYAATGNQERQGPTQEEINEYNNTVANNPDTIMSVIASQGISADWITFGSALTMDGGNRNTTLGLYSINHNSGTASKTYTLDLPAGLYLVLHGVQTSPVAAAQGVQMIVIGTTSGSTPLITTLTGGGSEITATSGTRSQVTMGNSDGTSATLTWTVQGRTYRRLELIRLN